MKEGFFKFAPFILIAVGAIIWLAAFILKDYSLLNSKFVIIFCIFGQLLLLFYCGVLIRTLHKQVNIDSLTGVCNRRCFYKKVAEISKMKFPVSLMMLDIDNFKKINDTYGHLVGDEVLRQFAEILKDNTRSTDIIARLGGEEFAVVLPQTCCNNVLKMGERIKQTVEENTFSHDIITVEMTVSIGVATTELSIHIDSLLKLADKALYKAKETKNVVVAHEQMEIVTA